MADNFLPKFNISKDLSNDMRNIKIANAIVTGMYKGKFHMHMKKAGLISMIDGKEYYMPMQLRGNSGNFFNKDTVGYHMAEVMRLIGIDDTGLKELNASASQDGLDGVLQRWIAKDELSKERFKKYLENMKADLVGIDTIEVDYELQRYRSDIYTTEASRVYNTRESIFGVRLPNGQFFNGFTSNSWSSGGKYVVLPDYMNKSASSIHGNAIRFKSGTVDVTNLISADLKYAVQSMIAYSGIDFMDRLSSTKIGEISYSVSRYRLTNDIPIETKTYISAIGTEVYNAHIKNAFILDANDFHWNRYTKLCTEQGSRKQKASCKKGTTIPATSTTVSIDKSTQLYSTAFWSYTHYTSRALDSPLQKRITVQGGDEFLFRDSGYQVLGAYIDVKAFNKLTLDEIGYYLSNYFDVNFIQSSSGGGFFGGFMNFIGGLFGLILNTAFQIIKTVPFLYITLVIITWFVNQIFGSDLTEREMFDIIAQVVVAVGVALLAAPTGGASIGAWATYLGTSVAISTAFALGREHNKAEDKRKENEKFQAEKRKNQELLQEKKKQEAEQDEKEAKFNNKGQSNEREEFKAFLQDPLYKFKQERKQIDSAMKSQFKLK